MQKHLASWIELDFDAPSPADSHSLNIVSMQEGERPMTIDRLEGAIRPIVAQIDRNHLAALVDGHLAQHPN